MYRAAPERTSRPEPEDEPDEEGGRDNEPLVLPVRGGNSGMRSSGPTARMDAPPARVEQLVPVQQISVRKGSEDVVEPQQVVKGYEYEKNRFVAIEPEELKSIAPKTATQMEISEFVTLAQIDPVYFETSYYVVPEEAGEKAYALLYKALQTSGLVAVAQFAMHSREHVVIVRPARKGLIAHTMFFSLEVRGDEEYRADVDAVSGKELELAGQLIHSLAAPFEPGKYRDTYREKVEEIIAKKVAGQPLEVAEKPSRSAAVVDITEALQRSLAALKKPAVRESSASKATAGENPAPKRTPHRKTARSH